MSANTRIEWADHTFNPWIGCTKVGPGCDNCYAKAEWDDRRHRAVWGAGQPRSRTQTWGDPVKWNKNHEAFYAEHGRRQRVFCASLADVFDNEVDPQWRADLFRLIEVTPNLDWLLLTKRIGNVEKMVMQANWPWPLPPNIWIGATIVSQEEADRDIPKLLAVPAAKRFLSMEPLLGPVSLEHALWKCCGDMIPGYGGDGFMQPPDPPDCCGHHDLRGELHWVIVGGESGPGARPMHPDWARSLRDQCQAAGVPFLFKQWGEWVDFEHLSTVWWNSRTYAQRIALAQVFLDGKAMNRAGKSTSGRELDGRTWDEVPAP